MNMPDFLKRFIVKLFHVKPKVFDGEEKAKMIRKLTEENRTHNRNVNECEEEFHKGLTIEEIKLGNCEAWFISRKNNPPDKVIYYIHGGGFVGACTKDRMRFVSTLVREFNYNVFSIDYRLAPEYMHPSQLNDCVDGYRYLLERYSSDNIVIIGESAGATLSFTLSVYLRDKGIPLPKAIFPNSICAQFDGYTDSYEKNSLVSDFIVVKGILENTTDVYFHKGEETDPYLAPLHADMQGLPPVYLTVSRSECLLDDSRMLYQKLKEAGNECTLKEYDGLCHAFIISPQLPGVREKSYQDLCEFLNKYLG